MRKYKEVIAVVIVVLVLALSLGSWAVGQASDDSDINVQSVGPMGYTFSKMYEAHDIEIAATADEPNDIFSFVPQDLNTNATILFLTNTTSEAAIAKLSVLNALTNNVYVHRFPIRANSVWTCGTDDIVPNAGVWSTFTRLMEEGGFGPSVNFAMLELPPGVVADGYVVWDGADDEYDPGNPNENAATMPLQFNYLGSGHVTY